MKITEQEYKESAELLGCDIASIKAVDEVEAPNGGFDKEGRLTMLFEPHIFWKQLRTMGLSPETLIKKYPSILSPIWNRELYAKTIEGRWEQLQLATTIHKESAYNSCSWGKFQIMGFNAKRAGYKNVFDMVDSFGEGEGNHLKGFCKYVIFSLLDDELKNKDWAGFARQYNGKLYYKNEYDKKLEKAYNKFKTA